MVLPVPAPADPTSRWVRDRRQPKLPGRDERGAPLPKNPARTAPDHRIYATDPALRRELAERSGEELERNRYYWHRRGDWRWCHYRDNWGNQWYGFYRGSSFYWTRREFGRWWWFDGGAQRWTYWDNGYWWWPDPAGPTTYVLLDDAYYPYQPDEQGVVLPAPPASTPPEPDSLEAEPAPPPEAQETAAAETVYSPDGTRLVRIVGPRREASLFDRSSGETPRLISYLAGDVKDVSFSDGGEDQPLQVFLTLSDGTFLLFDGDGRRFNPQEAGAGSLPPSDEPPSDLSVPPAPDETAPAR